MVGHIYVYAETLNRIWKSLKQIKFYFYPNLIWLDTILSYKLGAAESAVAPKADSMHKAHGKNSLINCLSRNDVHKIQLKV